MLEADQLIPQDQKLRITKSPRNKSLQFICNTLVAALVMALIAMIVMIVILNPSKLYPNRPQSLLQMHQIKHPIVDRNQYKFSTLQNQMKILLIHNPDAQLAQVSMNVKAGSWQESVPGLAHFLEHMLFEGSLKYPEFGHFSQLIAENGGSTNAYTDSIETNYFFTIQQKALKQGLDVFSRFFIDPSLDKAMVDKEAHAVHSEYEISITNDNWKPSNLMSLLGHAHHPITKFTMGNLDTLLKDGIEHDLRDFYDKYYSSNLMALVIESSHSLNQLEQMLHIFEEVENKKLVEPDKHYYGKPFEGEQVVNYKVNSPVKSVLYYYELDDVRQHYETNALHFINQLLNQKHTNSLYQHLMDKQLIIEMSSAVMNEDNGSYSFLVVQVIVEDTKQYALIGQAITAYFNLMMNEFFIDEGKTVSDSDTLKSKWQECKNINNLLFQYSSAPIDDIFELSHNLNFYPHQDVLSANTQYSKYNPEIVYNILSELMDPTNMMILIGDADAETTESNELYNLQYRANKIDKETLDIITKSVSTSNLIYQQHQPVEYHLALPATNNYVPQDLQLKSICNPHKSSFLQEDPYANIGMLEINKNKEMVFTSLEDCLQHEREYEEHYQFPELLARSNQGRLWWQLQRSYNVPAVFAGINMVHNRKFERLSDYTLLMIFQTYTEEVLDNKLSDARNVGFSYQFNQQLNGLSLTIQGWSDKFNQYYSSVIDTMVQVDSSDEARSLYENTIKGLILEQEQRREEPLYSQLKHHYLPQIFKTPYYTPIQLAEELKSISFEKYNHFKQGLFAQTHVVTYLSGNILREEANLLYKQTTDTLISKTQQKDKVYNLVKVMQLRNNFIIPIMSPSTDLKDTNGATLNYYSFGHRTRTTFAIMNLLKGSFYSQAFSYLRTDLQLGYAVSASFQPMECLDGATILVQGSTKPPYQVNQHIEEFLAKFEEYLDNMNDEEFSTMKDGAISQLAQKDKSLFQASARLWNHIKNGDYIFEEREIAIDEINQLQIDQVRQWYKTTFAQSKKVSVQIYGKGMADKLKSDNLQDLLNQQSQINNYNKEGDKVATPDSAKSGAYAYLCSYRLSNI